MKFVTATELEFLHRSIFPDLVSMGASRAASEDIAGSIDDGRQRLSVADGLHGCGVAALTWSGALHAAVLVACLAVSVPRPPPPIARAEVAVQLVMVAAEPVPVAEEFETTPARPEARPSPPQEPEAVAEPAAPEPVIAAPASPPEKTAAARPPAGIPGPKPPRLRSSPPQPPASPANPAPVAAAAAPQLPPDYAGRITARLLAVKRYPPQARSRREEGTILIGMILAADGSVISTRIDRSSGVTSLDSEGLAMVARAAPFPPLPDTFKASPLALVVPVTFALHAE